MFVFPVQILSPLFSFHRIFVCADKNPEERNVLDELLGENPNDDDDLRDEPHLAAAASGESSESRGVNDHLVMAVISSGKRMSAVARRQPMPGSVYKSKKFEAAISKLRKVCSIR